MSDTADQKVIGTDQPSPDTKTDREEQKAINDYSQREANGELSMRVKVHSPFRDYYDGQAFSVTAENATGPFDILPKHHNFISLLLPCELILRTVDKGDQRIRISGGIIHVKADRIIVFLDV
jgi:F0F1-type ATP synthase epsilon subunit